MGLLNEAVPRNAMKMSTRRTVRPKERNRNSPASSWPGSIGGNVCPHDPSRGDKGKKEAIVAEVRRENGLGVAAEPRLHKNAHSQDAIDHRQPLKERDAGNRGLHSIN
jgi:hypothetical protein